MNIGRAGNIPQWESLDWNNLPREGVKKNPFLEKFKIGLYKAPENI